MNNQNPKGLLYTAVQHHQSSNLPQAEIVYLQTLEQQSDNANVLHLLGV